MDFLQECQFEVSVEACAGPTGVKRSGRDQKSSTAPHPTSAVRRHCTRAVRQAKFSRPAWCARFPVQPNRLLIMLIIKD
jgi:hypothetical protein